METEISVIIPSFNRLNLLKRAIDSVVSQKYKNWELIIVDNYSHEKIEELIKSYQSEKIRFYKIKNDGVIAKSRNLGIELSKGQWIAFLDSDDWWTEDKLSYCSTYFDNDIDLIYHSLEIIREDTKSYFKKYLISKSLQKPVLNSLLTCGNMINNSSVIVRKSVVINAGKLDQSKQMVTAEDYNLWLKIAESSYNFKYINKALGYYFVHKDNILRHDMSVASKHASEPFIHKLSQLEKKTWIGNHLYMSARYDFLSHDYNEFYAKFRLYYSRFSFTQKLKSIYMILLIVLVFLRDLIHVK